MRSQNQDKEYAPIAGIADFTKASAKLAFGEDSECLKNSLVKNLRYRLLNSLFTDLIYQWYKYKFSVFSKRHFQHVFTLESCRTCFKCPAIYADIAKTSWQHLSTGFCSYIFYYFFVTLECHSANNFWNWLT